MAPIHIRFRSTEIRRACLYAADKGVLMREVDRLGIFCRTGAFGLPLHLVYPDCVFTLRRIRCTNAESQFYIPDVIDVNRTIFSPDNSWIYDICVSRDTQPTFSRLVGGHFVPEAEFASTTRRQYTHVIRIVFVIRYRAANRRPA